jgi:hypothetical protein
VINQSGGRNRPPPNMRTLEHREVLSFLRGVQHALHVVQQRGGARST